MTDNLTPGERFVASLWDAVILKKGLPFSYTHEQVEVLTDNLADMLIRVVKRQGLVVSYDPEAGLWTIRERIDHDQG